MTDWACVIKGAPTPPVLLGAELEPYPFVSGFGLLWRIARLGRLMPGELRSLGIYRRATDVLAITSRPGKSRTTCIRAVGLQSTRVADYWRMEAWCPMQTLGAFDSREVPLKRCPACDAHGYHCALFQLPSIDQCPWHGKKLYSTCPDCGATCWSQLDDDYQLGRCICGLDPFEEQTASIEMWTFPTNEAQEFLSSYLRWASTERPKCWLVVPEGEAPWNEGFSALAHPPQRLVSRGDPLRDSELTTFSGAGVDPVEREFWGWCHLSSNRPTTHAPLPEPMHQQLCSVTQAVAREVAHYCSHNFANAEVLGNEVVGGRLDRFILPHGTTSAGLPWLNLSSVDLTSVVFCGRLLDTALLSTGFGSYDTDCSFQAAQSQALDSIEGRRHLARTLETILLQGYRQGLGLILRRLIQPGQLAFKMPWRVPVAKLITQAGRIEAVSLAWSRSTSPHLPPKPKADAMATTTSKAAHHRASRNSPRLRS